ncbi:hypothetical protein [Nocardioides dokdonensis]|uniref:hypothetical protein n=1 Tax=Nocardioides dokdonensis TaxID=450734 RepID=UPI000A5368DF|nr:hypothetical protein [Nocardioides dokdonensis]
MNAWAEYETWDRALARHLFTDDSAGLPVYLEVTPEIFSAIADELGVEGDPADHLAKVVRKTLYLDDRHGFDAHRERFQMWRRHKLGSANTLTKRTSTVLEPPPVVALLAVLVMAAERMGKDTSQAAHAYYPRLAEVLGLNEAEGTRLHQAFPITEVFWRGLNDYLVAHEGRLGLPTADALSFRYVGIPQSQALVRASDRVRLPAFFTRFGLAPGSEVIPADLERLMDAWISGNPCPVSNNLKNLWGRGAARERVAGVAAVELSLWDGAFRDSSEQVVGASGQVSLCANLRQTFGGRSIELSFVARLPRPTEASELMVNSAAEKPVVGVIPAAGGRVRPIPGSRFDAESLVGALLGLQEPVSGETVTRRPRRVVPLRRDELVGALVETDRLQLADDVAILVKDDERLLKDVLRIIDQCGKRGGVFRSTESSGAEVLTGLPAGWVLIENVQLYAVPQDVKHVDLHALVPLTTAQLNLAGGMKMPGRIRKFSSLQPPEIRAAVAEAENITVTITSLGDEVEELHRWTESANAIVIPLDGLGLGDGDYEVTLQVDDEVLSRPMLRLRSADTPDAVTWETATPLNYELDSGATAVVSAVASAGTSTLFIDGVNTVGQRDQPVPDRPIIDGIGWEAKKVSSKVVQPVVVLGTADPNSCMVTGKHYIQLPTWHGGKATSKTIQGVCRDCGVVKTSPARPRWKKLEAQTEATVELHLAQYSAPRELQAQWDTCLDTVVHVGGGLISALDRIASHADGTSLFADEFVRALELAGHIDVRRDDAMAPQEWEANPAYLAETVNNGFLLAGVWSRSLRDLLAEKVEGHGGQLVREGSEGGGLSAWFARGLSGDDLEDAMDAIGHRHAVVRDAPRRMLAALPPLSELEAAMAVVPIPHHSKATLFSLRDASWQTVPGVGISGAYRVEQSFRRLSIWVDQQGAVDRTARIGSVQLVKHLAGRAGGRPLVGYAPSSQALVVPIGADLPGLYGRVAALCSGRLPSVSTRSRSIAYLEVPRDIANGLNSLLAG